MAAHLCTFLLFVSELCTDPVANNVVVVALSHNYFYYHHYRPQIVSVSSLLQDVVFSHKIVARIMTSSHCQLLTLTFPQQQKLFVCQRPEYTHFTKAIANSATYPQ